MKLDWMRIAELAVLNPGRAILSEVKKETPDDGELYCVRAVGIVHIPFTALTGNGPKTNFKIQEISSAGVWGESPDIDEELPMQREELFGYLNTLNVVIPEEFTKEG